MSSMQIDLGDYRLNYKLVGNGPETLTLTHGLGDHGGTWEKQLEQLAQDYQVLTWDLRAHGMSDSPAGPWTIADLSADLFRLLNALDITTTHLIGHSAGGAISTHFALRYPQLVHSLTLVGSASEANEKAAQNYERLAQKAEQAGGNAILKAVGLKNVPGSIAPDGPGFAKAAPVYGRAVSKSADTTAQRTGLSGSDNCRGKGFHGPRRLAHLPP